MRISHRATQLPASPIRRLAPLARQAAADGVEVIPLNIGQPDVPSPPEFQEAVRAYSRNLLPYSASEGDPGLIRSLQGDFERRLGIHLEGWQLIITIGGSEAITFALQSVADHGDNILVAEPFYTNYRFQAWSSGLDIRTATTDLRGGHRLPPPDVFLAQADARTRAVMINSPGNPTGAVVDRKEFQALLDACTERGLWLISDEVYRELVYDDAETVSALQLHDPDNRVIVVDSLSKRYDLCGSRVGMLVTRDRDVRETALKFAQARLSAPTLDQMAAARMIDQVGTAYIDSARAIYKERRDAMAAALGDFPGVHFPVPRGAFYALVDLPVDDAEEFSRFLLRDFRLEGATCHLTPAEDFYMTPGLGRSQVRLAFVVEVPRLEKAARILKSALPAYAALRAA